MKRLFITGYKPFELGIFSLNHPGIAIIKKAIAQQLIALLDDGLEWVLISGQQGVETWAAEVVIELQYDHPNLKYAVITPFEGQEQKWNEQSQERYENLLVHADYVVSLTKRPYEAPWQFKERDKFLLRNSDGLLLVYDEENEGSPKYIKQLAEAYTFKTKYELLTITAFDLQLIAEDIERAKWGF